MKLYAAMFIIALISYFLGSVNSAIIVTKMSEGKDIRELGSGNAGMTNVLRNFGKKQAILTTCGDIAKGMLAEIAASVIMRLFGYNGNLDGSTIMLGNYIALLFAMFGHVFPVYYKFKGGKGILVSVAAVLLFDPVVGLILIALFGILLFLTKMVSVGSVTAALFYPIVTFIWHSHCGTNTVGKDTFFAAILGIVIIIKHWKNIERILNGTESKIGQKSVEKNESKSSLAESFVVTREYNYVEDSKKTEIHNKEEQSETDVVVDDIINSAMLKIQEENKSEEKNG